MPCKGTAEAFTGLQHQLSQLSKAHTDHSIYKIHNHLHSVNDKAYEPKIIAIGPYHHGKDSLQMMEEHKLRYLELLLRRKKQNVERYISAVAKLEKRARNCYAQDIGLTQTDFIKMLVLDGCFIIELIRKCNRKDSSCKNDPIFKMDWIMNSLLRDLILFENQIPFFVLCELFDLIEHPNQHDRLIYLILFFCQSLYPGAVHTDPSSRKSEEIKHLLDLIHANWRPSLDENAVSVDVEIQPDIVRTKRNLRFIHSASELSDANVQFEVQISNSLFDLDFKNGVMFMPTLTVEDRTECFFRNLIAYEQYFPDERLNFVTDYVRLLDCLINSTKDVEILSECGIIDNWLGDNQVVADIFNKLTDSIVGPGKHFMYSGVVHRVNQHYERPWNRAVAVLRQDYFSNPWAIIGFLAALLLFLLTIVQTVLAVIQTV
ncbi:hypothetical protein STAS_32492 [Striga asiatica]|uniref:Uncharacterized protein n=1 Tax=Striga asiatica TaxID=4170 RepID=A0A5A7RB73_STRAF|nr:hypothetical protein STAS_32492 [Striga asiatica]